MSGCRAGPRRHHGHDPVRRPRRGPWSSCSTTPRRSAARRPDAGWCSGSTARSASKDARGADLPPVLLRPRTAACSRTTSRRRATARSPSPIASEPGWSLVGVLGVAGPRPGRRGRSGRARGLDAALDPFVPGHHRRLPAVLSRARRRVRASTEEDALMAHAEATSSCTSRSCPTMTAGRYESSPVRPGAVRRRGRSTPTSTSPRRATRCRPTRSCPASRPRTPRAPSATGCRRSC